MQSMYEVQSLFLSMNGLCGNHCNKFSKLSVTSVSCLLAIKQKSARKEVDRGRVKEN